MAFSGTSYFAGVGTVVAAIGLGFACGAMLTNSMVQPPNKLERASAAKASPSASTPSEQAGTATAAAQDAAPSAVVVAAPSPAPNSPPAPQPEPAAPTASKIDVSKTDAPKTNAVANVQEQASPATAARNVAPVPAAKAEAKAEAKGDEQAPAKSERTTVGRAVDPNRDASRSTDLNREATRRRANDRRPSDDRKFSERKRRQDQDGRRLDEASDVVRQMPRDNVPDEVVERDQAPRFGGRPHRIDAYEDDDSPRLVSEPPPRFFSFFGN